MASAQVHAFRLTAAFGPADVFRALQETCADPALAGESPAFEFDWIKRRIALSAASEAGLAACLARFLAAARTAGGEDGAFLPGRIEGKDGRFLRPIGVMVMDPASLGELVGRTLVDLGLRGVRIVDSADACTIEVARNFIAERIDYVALVNEFPVPSYVRIEDLGIRAAAQTAPAAGAGKKKHR